MITVRDALMPAIRSMGVRAPVLKRAAGWIGLTDLDHVFVDVIPMHVIQMTIVDVVYVAVMAHSSVSAVRTVLMRVTRMMLLVTGGHGFARLSRPSVGLLRPCR
jgi:hypothetical protein